MKMQSIHEMKENLKNQIFDQGFHWRILFIGTSVNGTTDIVSSLSRSLRNLGHHVLDLDTSRHRILNNPLRRQGGMGPVYVDYDKISSTVEAHKPQMIICCAGGLTFTEVDAEKLKRLGIVLVGITLSDPDVFPSIQEHQHVFDFHTTNAEIALEMYSDAGIKNTLYFPFGIDRGFVTQDVPPVNSFDADVICLGHATNRPDRNSVMTYLDERFDVKTYGRGWEIPNSETVAGQEMVQALQGGKIHVNFPLTRAGFINIKCGVFESAGQGRVVATGEFDEMSEFFEYDTDIIGYKDERDLAEKIERLLNDPDEYERIATNGFRRIVTEHLYEHRWMALFDEIRSVNGNDRRWFSRERALQISTILAHSLPRAKKVIVSGFYGARNLGDEMILRSISCNLKANDPAIEVFVAAENPTSVEARHGLQAFERRLHAVAAYQVKTASAVILGGGGLWHDYTFERGGGLAALFTGGKISMAGFGILPMMAKVVGAQFHVVGLGVGPLDDTYAKATVKYLADQADSIYVRDPESSDLLVDVGVARSAVVTAPDSVYGVELDESGCGNEELKRLKDDNFVIVGLNLRPWANGNMVQVASNVHEALTSLSRDLSNRGQRLAVVSLPMQAGLRMDRAAAAEVLRVLPADIAKVELSKEGELSLDEYLGALAYCDVLIAMRLHASLIAHRVGVPAVGLCYDPKVRRHYEEIDRAAFGLDLLASPLEIKTSLERGLEDGLSHNTKRLIKHHETSVAEALNSSARAIGQIADAPRVYGVPKDDEVAQKRKSVKATTPLPATFQKMKAVTKMISPEPSVPSEVTESGLRELRLALDTQRPQKGMYAMQSGVIHFDRAAPYETILKIDSKYVNSRAEGCIYIEFEISGYKYRHDLSESSVPVELRLTSDGKNDIPFVFRVIVERESFRARSWLAATTVTMTLDDVRLVKSNSGVALKASSGSVGIA